MVEVIIEQEKGHETTINLIRSFDKYLHDEHAGYMIRTQEYYKPHEQHEYLIGGDWTIKIADDKLFIIAEHIVSTIDLTVEAPFEISIIRD